MGKTAEVKTRITKQAKRFAKQWVRAQQITQSDLLNDALREYFRKPKRRKLALSMLNGKAQMPL